MDKKVKRELIKYSVELLMIIVLMAIALIMLSSQNEQTIQKITKQQPSCEWLMSSELVKQGINLDPEQKVKLYNFCKDNHNGNNQ